MSDLNCLIIKGRLTSDPETKTLPSGKSITQFSIANNVTWVQEGQKKEKANYLECFAWEKQGEIIQKFFQKGSSILLRGELDQQTWESEGKKMSKYKLKVAEFSFIDRVGQVDKVKEHASPATVSALSDDEVIF